MIKSVFLRRMFAWIIDAPLYNFPAMVVAMLLVKLDVSVFNYIALVFLVIFAPLTFVLRDVISKGRSFGKRMFELNVLDKSSNKPASKKQKIIRNLFFLFYLIDGIILIVEKETIGDKVANTVVVKN